MKYRKEIDGLRALALLPVVFSHAGFKWFKGTYVMIDLFFVISGYLITSLIAKEKNAGTFSIIRFYERRARRLLPALYVMMLICLPLAWLWIIPSHSILFWKSLLTVPIFGSNFLFWAENDYFHPSNRLNPFLQTWSLSVEEQFYLLFPFFFLLLWPKGKKKMGLFFCFISIFSFACMAWGLSNDRSANWYLLPGRIWEFVLGALIALLPERANGEKREKLIANIASIAGLIIIIVSVFNFDDYQPFPSFYTVFPLFGTALLIRFANSETLTGKLLGAKPLVSIGLISYGVFVWHQPLFAFAREYFLEPIAPHTYAILILISFVLAYLSFRFIETPFRNPNFLKRRTFFIGCLLVSLGFMAFGYWGVIKKGFPERFTINEYTFFSKARFKPASGFFWKGRKMPVHSFLKSWNNPPSEEYQLKKIPVAIYGNSFSSDIAEALRVNGRAPLQFGAADCNRTPNEDPKFCMEMFKAFISKVQQEPFYKYIAIAQKQNSASDISVKELKKKIDFWKQFGRELIVFSIPPRFPWFKERVVRGKYPKGDYKLAELSLKKDTLDYLKSQNVTVVNSLALFCSLTPNCDFKKGDRSSIAPEELIQVDDDHLSEMGHREFGQALISNYPIFE